MKLNRKVGSQDVSWFLDQFRLERLDLAPSYQRKSVWTAGDRRYFLDTVFRDFPCPPIYLHKTIDRSSNAIYHVVDGKQRLETIIRFAAQNKVRLPADFGDARLNNKRWKDIIEETDLRNAFLNYTFVVEYFDDVESSLVNEIFARMNKNSRKLTPQEVRNARFDGWFSREVDSEVENAIWKTFGIVTPGRARRMADSQFIAELLMVILQNNIAGFDQEAIDETYATYDDIPNPDVPLNVEDFKEIQSDARQALVSINEKNGAIAEFCSTFANMYTLWSLLVLNRSNLPEHGILAERYKALMREVEEISNDAKNPEQKKTKGKKYSAEAEEYFQNNQSATTELPQRSARLQALKRALKI